MNLNLMVTLSDIQSARSRLHGITVHTALIEFKLRAEDPRRLFLKPENQQPIGAFKLRGAYNKIASLSAEDRKRGVITTHRRVLTISGSRKPVV